MAKTENGGAGEGILGTTQKRAETNAAKVERHVKKRGGFVRRILGIFLRYVPAFLPLSFIQT